MKTKMYAIYDSKAESYGTPFFMPTRGMAIRAFSDLARDPNSSVSKHLTDFTLFEIGFFDDSKGMVGSIEPQINLGFAVVSDGNPAAAPVVIPDIREMEMFEKTKSQGA